MQAASCSWRSQYTYNTRLDSGKTCQEHAHAWVYSAAIYSVLALPCPDLGYTGMAYGPNQRPVPSGTKQSLTPCTMDYGLYAGTQPVGCLLNPNSISLVGRKPGRRLAWRARAGRRQVESTSRTCSKTVRCWRHKWRVWPDLYWHDWLDRKRARSITTCWHRSSTLSTMFSTRKVLGLSWAGRRPGLAGRKPGRKPGFSTGLSTC